MKTKLIVLFCLVSLFASAQQAGDGTGRYYAIPIDIVGPNQADTTSGYSSLYLSQLRGTTPVRKDIEIRDARFRGRLRPNLTSSPADDSLLNFRDASGNAYRRVLPDGIIRMEWIGLNGDGVTDNTARLQRFFDLLPRNAEVTLSDSGVYACAGTVTITKPVNIRVLGKKISFKETTNFTSLFYSISDSVSLDNFVINQTGTGDVSNFPYGYGAGVIFRYAKSGCKITNSTIANVGFYLSPFGNSTNGVAKSGAAVYMTRSGNVIVDNCTFINSVCGAQVDGFGSPDTSGVGYIPYSNNIVRNCTIQDCYKGLEVDFTDAAGGKGVIPGKWTGNTFINTPAYNIGNSLQNYGMLIGTNFATTGLLVENNHFIGLWGNGIGVIKGSYYTKIINNDITGAYTGVSLFSQGGSQIVQRVDLSHNNISYCKAYGILATASYDLTFTGNTIINNLWGVQLQGFCFNAKLNENIISHNLRYGVGVVSCYGLNIQGGDIVDNGDSLGVPAINGDTAGIVINKAGAANVVNGVVIKDVTFDYGYSGSGSLVQKYSIKTFGTNYQAASSVGGTGFVGPNTYGRTAISESMVESAFGLRYRNGTTFGASDSLTTNNLFVQYNPSNALKVTVGSTGSATFTATGTGAQFLFSGSNLIAPNIQTSTTTPLGSNFYTPTGTSILNTSNPLLSAFGSSTTGFRVFIGGGSLSAGPGGSNSYAGTIFAPQDFTMAASGLHPMVTTAVFNAPTITYTAGGSIGYITNLFIRNKPTLSGAATLGVYGFLDSVTGRFIDTLYTSAALANSGILSGAVGDSVVTTKAGSKGVFGRVSMASLHYSPWPVVISNATTLTLNTSTTDYVFNGTTAATWTLPALSTGIKYFLKNRGTVNVTLTAAGSDQIFNTALGTTFTMTPGAGLIVFGDGTYWDIE